jgi:TolB-like protein/Flp pilus assembly protein TadD
VESQEGKQKAIRRQLESVLSSATFARSERLSRFLRFVVERYLEGEHAEIKESLLGVEVFGRKPGYDPKQDSIVRTEAGRLRARLIEYYAREGGGDAIIIELPKGGYIPKFRYGEAPHEQKSLSARLWLTLAIGGLAVTVAVVGWRQFSEKNMPIIIAVLPLENLSHDSGDEYIADGLTDEIIRNLAAIDGLAVRSRTSSFALKGKARNVREATTQLGADYFLEGSVLRDGDHLRVNTQLVRVRDDLPLWSSKFDRKLEDVFAIQDEIARGIVNNLRLKLGGGRRRYETNIDVYDLYLRARALPLERGVPGVVQSVGLFEQVIARDPSFVPAYAELGVAYAVRSIQFPVDHPADELAKMRSVTEKAMQLDPLLAEAHHALGLVRAHDGDWEQSEKSFHRAIDIDPNSSTTYLDYSFWLLAPVGRVEEALRQSRVAERVDPLSAEVHRTLAALLISAGRYDEAAHYWRKLPADDAFRNQFLARIRLGQGKTGEAIQLLTNDSTLSTNPQTRGLLGYAYGRSGRREEAEKLAAAAHYANEQALIFAGLDDKDRLLEALDRMALLGPQRVGLYINYPELAILRSDPRLAAFRKKVGLPK